MAGQGSASSGEAAGAGPGPVLTALCTVLFDVDLGNHLEQCWPAGALTDEEQRDVAFHAFPDSVSVMADLHSRSSVRDSSFLFRIRRRPPPAAVAGAAAAAVAVAAAAESQFLYGFVFCRQRQDERLRRGGEQRSVVVLSPLPLSSLLTPLSRYLGPLAFTYGEGALQQVWEEVQEHWAPLEWGSGGGGGGRVTLPLGHDMLSVELPPLCTLPPSCVPAAALAAAPAGSSQREHLGSGSAAGVAAAALAEELDEGTGLPPCLLPSPFGQQEVAAPPFAETDVYTPLRAVLPQLWTLWELLLLGLPLLVVAPNPGCCSGAVAALLSLLAPFAFCRDFRPYFTIHDPAFAPLAAAASAAARNNGSGGGEGSKDTGWESDGEGEEEEEDEGPVLLGVTNLYFLKGLPNWQNVIATGFTPATLPPSSSSSSGLDSEGSSGGGSGERSEGGGIPRSASAASVGSSSGGGGGGGSGGRLAGLLLGRRRPAGPASLLSEADDGAWLAYRPRTRADTSLLGRLLGPAAAEGGEKWRRAAAVNTALLRRHFQELTRALLFPLLPYIAPTPPPLGVTRPADVRNPPPLQRLDAEALLARLGDKSGSVPDVLLQRFGGHKPLVAFYTDFLRSPNLRAWLRQRRAAARRWQTAAWRAAWWSLGGAAVEPALQHMDEVWAVQLFFQLESQLLAATAGDRGAGAAASPAPAASTVAAAVQPSGAEEAGEEGTEKEGELAQLRRELRAAFAALPPDLCQSLLLTPGREELLGSSGSSSTSSLDGNSEPANTAQAQVEAATQQLEQQGL